MPNLISRLPLIRATLALTLLIVGAMPASALDLNPLSAIKGLVEAAVEERSSDDIKRDLEIRASITAEVVDKMGTDVISINADVYEQDVMLTGNVEKQETKSKAEALARNTKGIKKLYNEILVITDLQKKKGAAENFVDDSVIETKINALLLDASGVNVTNFRWRSVRGHVFLFGRALSKAEHQKAVKIVKEIKNILSVKSRTKVVPK